MMEDIYPRERKDWGQQSRKGPVKRSFQVTALNGLEDIEEVVVVEEQTVPTLVVLNGDGNGTVPTLVVLNGDGNGSNKLTKKSIGPSELNCPAASDQLSTEQSDNEDEEENKRVNNMIDWVARVMWCVQHNI
jgi:hypothetical protein